MKKNLLLTLALCLLAQWSVARPQMGGKSQACCFLGGHV
jgi:hypothetical protein